MSDGSFYLLVLNILSYVQTNLNSVDDLAHNFNTFVGFDRIFFPNIPD